MDFDYYIKGNGRIHGPLTWDEVVDMASRGEVKSGFEAAKVSTGVKPTRVDFEPAGPLLSAVVKLPPGSVANQHAETNRDTVRQQVQAEESSAPAFAYLLYGLAIFLAVAAFFVAYKDSDYTSGIVGGDAYNYIIFAGRGAIWGLASVVCAVIGSGSHVAHSVKHSRSRAV